MIAAGTVVISSAGHDCGRAMMVVRIDGDYIFVADGKERKLEKPKKKNQKHVRVTNRAVNPEELTDRKLRRTLRELFGQDSALQESE